MSVKKFLFIRHGKTQGNLERRYVCDINEPICREGILEAEKLAHRNIFPPVNTLICGAALRCRQTAAILFPDKKPEICALSEINFGIFSGKNADELTGDREYMNWLETNCMGDIPGGDSVAGFKKRCCESFLQLAETRDIEIAALVIHGGNIMAIMEEFALPKRDFYAYHVQNCGYILCRYKNGALYAEREGEVL